MDEPNRSGNCELCEREQPLTFHHLIPRGVHSKNRYRKQFTKQEMRTTGLWICRLCHDGIHDLVPDEKELASQYNTKEKLLEHPGIAKHVGWVRKQK